MEAAASAIMVAVATRFHKEFWWGFIHKHRMEEVNITDEERRGVKPTTSIIKMAHITCTRDRWSCDESNISTHSQHKSHKSLKASSAGL